MGVASHLLSRWYKLVDILLHAFFFQEEAIVLANVAERAERYDDMIEYMKVRCICFSWFVGKLWFSHQWCERPVFLPLGNTIFLLCFFFPIFNREKNPWPITTGVMKLIELSPGPCQSWKSSQQRGTRNVLCGLQGAREVSCDDSGFVTEFFQATRTYPTLERRQIIDSNVPLVGKICGGDIWYMLVPRVSLLYLERFPTKKGVLECEIVVMRCFCQSKNHGRVPWAAVDWRSV